MLEQRLDLMEMKMNESSESWQSQKSMYESMLKALNGNSDSSAYDKYLDKLKELQGKQDEEIAKIQKLYEKQVMDLKQRCNLQEFNEKSLKAQLTQIKTEMDQELREKDLCLRETQLKMQETISEK